MRIRVIGADPLTKKLKHTPNVAKDAAARQLAHIANELKGLAVKRAPKALNQPGRNGHKGGNLRRSAYKVVKDLTAEVGFTAPYATRQHEHLEYHHTDGEAKYLENPFKENLARWMKELGQAINRAINERG